MADSVTFVINLDASDQKLDKKIDEKIKKKTVEKKPRASVPRGRKKKKPLSDSNSPVPKTDGDKDQGGIYGGTIEEPDKTFEQRQGVYGGIPVDVRYRDRVSKSPVDYERWIHREKRIEDKLSELEKRSEGLKNLFTKFGGGVGGASGLVSNPEGFISSKLTNIIGKAGPHGALAVAIISMITATPELAKMIITQLAVKGGPLNNDFKVIVEDIVVGFLSLSDQHRRDLGLDGFVVSQVGSYGTASGTDVTNSYLESSEIRINRVPQEER